MLPVPYCTPALVAACRRLPLCRLCNAVVFRCCRMSLLSPFAIIVARPLKVDFPFCCLSTLMLPVPFYTPALVAVCLCCDLSLLLPVHVVAFLYFIFFLSTVVAHRSLKFCSVLTVSADDPSFLCQFTVHRS